VPGPTAAEEAAEGRGSRQLDRLRTELDAAVDDLRRTKSRAKERLAQLRTENADLRRRVASLTQQASSAEQALAAASQQLAAEREVAGSAAGQAQAEARRLRARIAELEAESAAVRRAAREGRDTGSLRARLLLDALVDTAAGLRRELALPPVSGSPADTVTAGIPPGRRSAVQARGRAADDPDLLAERLALPGAHLVVDGYNVTKTAWPTATLETQRTRLLSGLAAVTARTGAEVTVVFDGADLDQPPALTPPRRVRVRFSPPGVIADDVIRILVAAEPPGRPVVVASSDREVAQGVEDSGATAVPAGALVNLLSRA
jgi:predicted RNA-binding protein with PIN domain